MKKVIIIATLLASLLLCSCDGSGGVDKLFERGENKVSISFVSCNTVESYQTYSNQTAIPSSGNLFKKVTVSITNNYNSTKYFAYTAGINYFKTVLANEHEYTDKPPTDNWQIMPGTTVEVTTYFEVLESESLNGAKLSFRFQDPTNITVFQESSITLGNSVDMGLPT